MTDWKKVTGATRPDVVDTTSSATTVYIRRNIKEVNVKNEHDDEGITMYEYEEKTFTKDEYANYISTNENEVILSGIQMATEYIACLTEFNL